MTDYLEQVLEDIRKARFSVVKNGGAHLGDSDEFWRSLFNDSVDDVGDPGLMVSLDKRLIVVAVSVIGWLEAIKHRNQPQEKECLLEKIHELETRVKKLERAGYK